jgi:hypothetical protein
MVMNVGSVISLQMTPMLTVIRRQTPRKQPSQKLQSKLNFVIKQNHYPDFIFILF